MDNYKFYRKFPYPLRMLAINAWGYYLRWFRYASETPRLVEQALERETWSREQWNVWQDNRLIYILNHAATTVPYYQNYWENRRRHGDKSSWEVLENWPKLEKSVVREYSKKFVSTKSVNKYLYIDQTSGTTGKPTAIYLSRKVAQQWFALHEARVRRWLGLDSHERWGIFGGQKVIPMDQTRPPYWMWNQGLHQIYFSIYHINQNTASEYVNALWKYAPNYLMVYPSALSILAKYILQDKLKPPKLKAIISNAESLTQNYKMIIQNAFDCPVIETYGMAEMISAASRCAEGSLHFWPETGIMEIYDPRDDRISSDPGQGIYCMTGLINEDMPLIRYVNGDMGQLPVWNQQCDCGRSLPIINFIKGRSKDLILTNDGRELYLLDSLFNGLPLVEVQLVQLDLDKFQVNVVPNKGYDRLLVENEIKTRLSQHLGFVSIKLYEVETIPRDINGKFQAFLSLINPLKP